MEDEENGKLYFISTNNTEENQNYFSQLIEVNSYSNNIKKFKLIKSKAMGITSNNELILWSSEQKKSALTSSITSIEKEKEKENRDNNSAIKNDFLLKNPIFMYNKIKMKRISLNKTMCLSLDINGNVLVWGENREGLLGLG